jgi:hypothetical protein
LFLCVFVLTACKRGADEQKAVARDLSRAMAPSSAEPTDSAAQRADSQFQTCLFVYDTEEKLRECLVVRNRWPAQDAARAIAIYRAKLARTVDSLRLAEQRSRDSIYRTRDRLDGPDARTYPDSGAWMADDRTGGYYRTSCVAA